MWEMQFRRTKEKLTHALMLRESILNPHAKSMSDTALDAYIESVAPFIGEEQRKKREEMFKVLEQETKTVFRVSPVKLPSRKVIPFKKPSRRR
jgi:hypothetical protein